MSLSHTTCDLMMWGLDSNVPTQIEMPVVITLYVGIVSGAGTLE